MSVLLGVPDRLVKRNETTTWETNKIGGTPDWFQANTPIPCCRKCQREMTLVTQIYCPLAHSRFHRCLHVFVCPGKLCSIHSCGWRAIRTQQLDDSSQVSCAVDDKWTDDRDDWGGQMDWGEDEEEEEDEEEKEEEDEDSQGEPHPLWSASQETTTDRLSQMSLSGQGHPAVEGGCGVEGGGGARSSPGRSSPDEASPAPGRHLHWPSALQGDNSTDSALPSAGEGDIGEEDIGEGDIESSQLVEAETMAVDGEGLQRMMGLLAGATGSSGNNEESDSKTTGAMQRQAFPAYYLDVMAEADVAGGVAAAASDSHVTSLLRDYQLREGVHFSALLAQAGAGQLRVQSEKYDRTEVLHGDKHCYKFIKKLQACPQQCIRYQWKGRPLLMGGESPTADRCPRCQEPRVFELQLVTPLLPFLTLPTHSERQVEFGTVLVLTCGASCWTEGETHTEEAVLLQHDADHHLFK